jgi:hypothetical protein
MLGSFGWISWLIGGFGMGGEQGLSIRIGMGSALIGFLFFID